MYDKILVPTDGSEATDRAVENAVDIASRYDATLHVLYVVDASVYASIETGADVVVGALEKEGETAVRDVVDRAEAAGVDVVSDVVTGSIHREILDYADEHGVDLIVMGTHGRTGLDRYLLGSVTEKVVRRSEVPVLTVRTADEGESSEGTLG
jgi:nucleotide-binding universal stress UspA family protein